MVSGRGLWGVACWDGVSTSPRFGLGGERMVFCFTVLALANVGLGFVLATYLARKCGDVDTFHGEE